MSINSRLMNFCINLQNGEKAIVLGTYPGEVLFYRYSDIVNCYTLDVIRHISPMESRILLLLLSNAGHIVNNDILQKNKLTKKMITNANLRQVILSLRILLVDNVSPYQLLVNKPRIGYGIYHVDIFYGTLDLYFHSSNAKEYIPTQLQDADFST